MTCLNSLIGETVTPHSFPGGVSTAGTPVTTRCVYDGPNAVLNFCVVPSCLP